MNSSHVRVYFFMIFAASLFLNFSVRPAMAKDVPMKLYGKVSPSDVYRVVVSISKVALYIAQNASNKTIRSAALALIPVNFTDKKSSDVVQIVYAIQDRLNVFRKRKGLKPVKRYSREDGRVTPAVVYINAGTTLDGLFEVATKIDQQKSIGDIFNSKIIVGKTPNDVYRITDYADRVLEVLARAD